MKLKYFQQNDFYGGIIIMSKFAVLGHGVVGSGADRPPELESIHQEESHRDLFPADLLQNGVLQIHYL